MQFNEFKRIVTCFADQVEDVDTTHGDLLLQVRDETITAKLHQRPDGLLVEEHGDRMPAVHWVVKRLARIPLLADRICSYVSPPEHFVTPSGSLVDQIDNDPSGQDALQPNVVESMTEMLGRRPGGTTSVLYLTSDAGEGKTSLINHLAVTQARQYKAKRSDWLLVPVPLGGRTFLRFDDVVVAALANRLRFQLLYYDAFLELVRLGVLVPAFDGFEEMIVESSSGEAISALGNLVGKLRSEGTLLVAARKAYFDYPNFGSQARLFDTIGSGADVAFGRLSLNRWNRSTFALYATARSVGDPERLFTVVSDRLGDEHPVLTRAVLVRRLVDVAVEENDLSSLLDRIGHDERDYFHEFVGGIVEREARLKWTDRSGDSSRALLTTDEHHELLSMVAQEMWLSATDELGVDVVSLVVEMFVDAKKKGPAVARQIQERLKQHALLVITRIGRTTLAFDHEDFRVFYLGLALGQALVSRDASAVKSIIDKAALPASAVAEAASCVRRDGGRVQVRVLALLQELADGVLPASYVRENCGVLTLALIDRSIVTYEVRNMSFPASSLRGLRLANLTVTGSFFHATTLTDTELRSCKFLNCHFERLELDHSMDISQTVLDECRIDAVVVNANTDTSDQIVRFAPDQIRRQLLQAGFAVTSDAPPSAQGADESHDMDEDLVLVQRLLRGFLRATALNEHTIRQRLGVKANHLFRDLLPQLEGARVVEEVQYLGSGTQRRIRLIAPMSRIEEAISGSGGAFSRFLKEIKDR